MSCPFSIVVGLSSRLRYLDLKWRECIDRRMYPNVSQSTQSAAGLKTLKPAASGRYLMRKLLPCHFQLLYISRPTFYPPVSKVQAGRVRVSLIYRTLAWTTISLTCVRDHPCACIYTRGLGTPTRVSTTFLTRKNSQVFLVFLTGFEPSSFGSWVWRSTHWTTPSPRCVRACVRAWRACVMPACVYVLDSTCLWHLYTLYCKCK